MSTSRIRIKMGPIEVECEGSEQFLKKELTDILAAVSRLHRERATNGEQLGDDDPKTANGSLDEAGTVVGTTATIAGRMKVKRGNDLVIAAAAHLTLAASQLEFTRQDLLGAMKGASGYYKESYGGNLSNYLKQALKAGALVEPRSGVYALSAKKSSELRSSLASG